MPQALWRKMEHDRVIERDPALALDPRHDAALMRGALDEAGAMAGVVLVDNLADITAGRIFEIDDQGRA